MTHKSESNTNECDAFLNEGIRLLESGDHEAALAYLQSLPQTELTSETHAQLGLAYFRNEAYETAAKHYHAALNSQPDHDEWRDMLIRARANAISGIKQPLPPIHFFDRKTLLAPATVRDGSLPKPLLIVYSLTALQQIQRVLGNAISIVATEVMNRVTSLWGMLAGYRDTIWTNWYRRPLFLGILTLAHMRECLNKNNLKSTYSESKLVGFQPLDQKPPEGVTHFRTANGTWNNLENPKEGAAGTRFQRNVANDAIRPETGIKLMTPNPREVSRRLLTRGETMREIPFLNLLAAAWIQFQNHDWISHGENQLRAVHEIPLMDNDPARIKYRQTHMFVAKTQSDPTYRPMEEQTPVTHINEVTHWWDGSQIYGSDQKNSRLPAQWYRW
jgi:tetratricopeptide (TPR) repeat protein